MVKKVVPFGFNEGNLYMRFRYRNVFFTLTTLTNEVKATSSVGCWGFKNAMKKTPAAVEESVRNVLNELGARGVKYLHLKLRGLSQVRTAALRKMADPSFKVKLLSIEELTSLPFGGCTPKKPNRRKKD